MGAALGGEGFCATASSLPPFATHFFVEDSWSIPFPPYARAPTLPDARA